MINISKFLPFFIPNVYRACSFFTNLDLSRIDNVRVIYRKIRYFGLSKLNTLKHDVNVHLAEALLLQVSQLRVCCRAYYVNDNLAKFRKKLSINVCCLRDKCVKWQCVSIILANNIRHEKVRLPTALLKYLVTPEEDIQNFPSIYNQAGNPRVELHSNCTVKRVHLSSPKAKPSPSNVTSGNVVQTLSLAMELDTSLPRAVKSTVKQLPEPVKIQSTHTSFSRGKYEDFRIYFVWTSDVQGESSSLCWLTKGKQLCMGIPSWTQLYCQIYKISQLHVSAPMAIFRLDTKSDEKLYIIWYITYISVV